MKNIENIQNIFSPSCWVKHGFPVQAFCSFVLLHYIFKYQIFLQAFQPTQALALTVLSKFLNREGKGCYVNYSEPWLL